ncbi:DUF5703 domain-containing protein [Prolixibacteraceae bacterium Z1-6]|uniref:DUF5703 domain-containing protein n=1 Tax=Draconibacterium aestuarii TaxID=2998507 RepID=A0A9X3F902_9BACT|nr:DUF5703 domain-containing protein [Prolixibacteraceae bacterium Z1-6]
MKKYIIILFIVFHGVLFAQNSELDNYNLVWNSQSLNSSESMPCGGGDIGLNVWAENGEILFYIARSGTFDENNGMPKLGRVRLKLTPNPFDNGTFKQELDLQSGSVKITGKKENQLTKIEIWVDVFSPVIHVDVESNQQIEVEAIYENWRFQDRVLEKNESFGNSYKWAPPKGLLIKKDEICFKENSLEFYHRNTGETMFDVVVRQQQMEAVKDQMFDPLKNLTFGGKMSGENFIAYGTSEGKYIDADFKAWSLKSKTPAKKQSLEIYLHTGQYGNLADWNYGLESVIKNASEKKKSARSEILIWWKEYWNKSFVFVQAESKNENLAEWQVGCNYQLFRYLLGCNAKGEYPTKFNGGLFTYDPQFVNPDRPFSPDFRNWGGGTFTAQNQRLVYFPMLKSGDFELIKPQLDFYKRILRNGELRSQHYWGHTGACFNEQIENFGLPNPSEYGWKRPEGYDAGMTYNAWLEYQWDTSLEFCWMAIQLHQYNKTDISEYIPLIESCLTFFDEHYQYLAKNRGAKTLDENGHLVLYPGSSCETYKMAYNATSTIAALKTVTKGLLELPEKYIDEATKEKWAEFLNRIPPLSFREIDGKTCISPAKLWERINNTEAPQLYPVYPWGIYGVGKPDLEIAKNTYLFDPDVQRFKGHESWKQYSIFAARLGLTEEAKEQTLLKLQDSGRRFPAFWGPGFDWVPDHNWGGSGMIGVQEMLLQTNGDKIYLFPAWPKDWDVHFKLHAPGNTVVEAQLKNGEATILKVEPAERLDDIEILIK